MFVRPFWLRFNCSTPFSSRRMRVVAAPLPSQSQSKGLFILRISKTKCALACAAFTATLLCGCSNLGKSYSQIDPEGALEDARQHNGYYAIKKRPAESTRLVMRGFGRPFTGSFELNASQDQCTGFERAGSFAVVGRGVLLPWIADMTSRMSLTGKMDEFLAKDIQPSQPIAVKAYGGWADYEQATKTSSNGRCGPVSAAFLPQPGRAYLAEMDWSGGQCQLKISDATDPDSLIPMEALPMKSCPASN